MALSSRLRRAFSRSMAWRARRRARRAEVSGRLDAAAALYLDAGQNLDAARLYAVLAESAVEPATRLQWLALAASVAPDDPDLERRRVHLALDLAKEGVRPLAPTEVRGLAETLERLGEPLSAADAYASIDDVAGQTRALTAAGAVERLESVLESHHAEERRRHSDSSLYQRVCDLELTGRRREALELCSSAGAPAFEDERWIRKRRELEQGRDVTRPVRLLLDGLERRVVFGSGVVIGRGAAGLAISSPSLSREHLVVRAADGRAEVVDLGSKNGTTLRGARVEGALPVGAGLELELGGEVLIRVTPAPDFGPPAVFLEVGAATHLLPLGPLRLGAMTLHRAADGWVELESEAAELMLGGLRVTPPVQLAPGDVIRQSEHGPVIVRMMSEGCG